MVKQDDSLLKEFEKLERTVKRIGESVADKADRQLGITAKIRGQMGQMEQMQSQMLARGSDITGLIKGAGDVTRQLTDGIDGLDSGLAGYQDAVGAAADAYRSGMETNNYAVNRLLLRSKFTDKQSQQLAHAMRAATAGTGMSSDQMGDLATTVQSLSERFNISASQLTGAMSALGKSLKMMKGLGIAKEGQEVAALFGAALGTGAEKFGAEFISKLAAGDAIKTRSMLGIQEQMQGFYKGGEGAAKALTEATVKAAFQVKKQKDIYTKGAGAFGNAYALGNAQFGGVWDEGMQLYNEMVSKYGDVSEETMIAMMEKEAKDKEIQNKFQETWDNVQSKIFGPLMEGLLKFQAGFYKLIQQPWFKDIIKVLSAAVVAISAWKFAIAPLLGILQKNDGSRLTLGEALTNLKDAVNKRTMKQTRDSKTGRFAGKKGALTRAADKYKQNWSELATKLQDSPFGKAISSGFTKMQDVMGNIWKRAITPLLTVFGTLATWIGSAIGSILLSPITAIVAAVVAIGALVYYFWEPIKKTFVDLWAWVKSIPSKIVAGFKKGFWAGIWALIKIFFKIPMMIVTGIWNVIKWLSQKLLDGLSWIIESLNPLSWFGSDDEKKSEEEANADSLEEQKKTNEMQEVQAKESQANLDEKKRKEIEAQQRQTTNELLRQLNEGMSAEIIRSEAVESLQEQALEAAKITAENSGRTRPSKTVTTYTERWGSKI